VSEIDSENYVQNIIWSYQISFILKSFKNEEIQPQQQISFELRGF
jgi:hypothetical protein